MQVFNFLTAIALFFCVIVIGCIIGILAVVVVRGLMQLVVAIVERLRGQSTKEEP